MRSAFVVLCGCVLALAGCGGEEEHSDQKDSRASLEDGTTSVEVEEPVSEPSSQGGGSSVPEEAAGVLDEDGVLSLDGVCGEGDQVAITGISMRWNCKRAGSVFVGLRGETCGTEDSSLVVVLVDEHGEEVSRTKNNPLVVQDGSFGVTGRVEVRGWDGIGSDRLNQWTVMILDGDSEVLLQEVETRFVMDW